jgi:cellobiose-specific phosphotransferase system component IIC
MFYQLFGSGTLHFVVKPRLNWAINIAIIALIVATTASNHLGEYADEKRYAGVLVALMALTLVYGVMKLKQLQCDYKARVPAAESKK